MSEAKAGSHADLVIRIGQSPPTVPRADTIDLSWQRCLKDFKLDPAREYQPKVLEQSMLREHCDELDQLVHLARDEMDSLYEQIAGSGYALLLADTQGIILHQKVDPGLTHLFSQAGLMVGADWSEESQGTNGIGTCVTEARPMTIHQADHFRSRHIGLSCSAAPIHSPSGEVLAVLDASCVNPPGSRESQLHTVALVNLSARLIEKCLFLRHHHGDTLLRFHHRPEFVDLLHDGAIAVAPDGCIVGSDATGLTLLGAEHRSDLLGRSVMDVFDLSNEEMLRAASGRGRAMWKLRDVRHGRQYFASLAAAGHSTSRYAPRQPSPPNAVVRIVGDRVKAALRLEDLAGEDPQMIRNVRNARRVSASTVSVIIKGPTGSGKEAFAKAMHLVSGRATRPFVAINCATIPESLIEAELFGYAPGAFTDARREGMRGRVVQSSGGTLFLDEIGDMPAPMQTRLLRVLEEQEVLPLGSEVSVKVDLRVICASHRDLRALVAKNRFREDLYYRLSGITLDLPSLAARRDCELIIRKCIARELVGRSAMIEAQALKRLADYHWPGNVRELRNAIRVALALCEDELIRLADLPDEIRLAKALPPSPSPRWEHTDGDEPLLEMAEREVLVRAIELHGSNVTRVAAMLNVSRNTVYRKMKRHGILLSRIDDRGA